MSQMVVDDDTQKVHIGLLIQNELRRQERGVSWFASKLCCDRTNVYKLFQRSTIDTELLWRISAILRHNFFRYYADSFVEYQATLV